MRTSFRGRLAVSSLCFLITAVKLTLCAQDSTVLLLKDGDVVGVKRKDAAQVSVSPTQSTDAIITERVSRLAELQLAGPSKEEAASGLQSLLPGECSLDKVNVSQGQVEVCLVLSRAMASQYDELVHERLQKMASGWAEQTSGVKSLSLVGRLAQDKSCRPLSSFLPGVRPVAPKKWEDPGGALEKPKKLGAAAPASVSGALFMGPGQPPASGQPQPSGALANASVFVSPGHGWYYSSSLGRWATQRGNYNNLIEDHSNAEAVLQNLTQYLWNAGARVYSCRERDLQTSMVVVDNSDSGFSVTGTWATSTSGGVWKGANYRQHAVSASGTSTARWTPTIPSDGYYGVYVWYPVTSNRSTDARYTINHTGGSTLWVQNQQHDGDTWLYLGSYYFAAGSSATSGSVVLSDQGSDTSKYVVADAVRFGGGMGDYADGGAVSGKPRWEESGKYFAGFMGHSYTNSTVSAMPMYAAWEHEAWESYPCYLSWHSNGFDGTARGTETYAYSSAGWNGVFNGVAGGDTLRNMIHDEVVNDIRAGWDDTWVDRGKKTADLGELNPTYNSEMPAALIEIGFHDTWGDAQHLQDPGFRRVVARAIYQGLVKWYGTQYGFSNTTLLPEPPTNLRLTNNGTGGVSVAWNAPPFNSGDNLLGDAATGYRLYLSTNGKGWDNGVAVSGLSTTLTSLSAGQTYFVRVSATNAGGESFPTETLAVRVRASGTPAALIVNGFDSLSRFQNFVVDDPYSTEYLHRGLIDRMNSFDYAIAHGKALAAQNVDFDSCSNEAVINGSIDLSDYHTVVWIIGEESVINQSFDATEQAKVTDFLNAGGHLLASGSDIAWELVSERFAIDFYQNTLHANYAADNADTYNAAGVAGGIFDGISLSFDDGTSIYDVDWPDVLSSYAGSTVCMNYSGGTGGAAAVNYAGGTPERRIVIMGFPFEAIPSEASRNAVMAGVVNFLGTAATPAAPTALTATAVSPSQINLAWTDNASNETNFVVARSTVNGGPYTDLVSLPANTTSYSNSGLAQNTTYYYVVRATNAPGSSANSNQANALTWPADIIVDNAASGFTASSNWSTGTSATDKYGANYRYRSTAAVSDAARWTVSVPQTRSYDIYAWWSAGANRSKAASYILPDGATVTKNQQTGGGQWNLLATKTISAGSPNVQLSCWATTGFVVVADAVKLTAK